MFQPKGAVCNLDCQYCYFLSKEKLYPDSSFHMQEALLEMYTRQFIGAQQVPQATFAWQPFASPVPLCVAVFSLRNDFPYTKKNLY
jgi:uncharacterized protein